MKQGICILTILLIALSGKVHSQALQATKDKALVRILVLNQDEEPVRESLELVAKSTGETYPAISDEKGNVSLLVPAGDSYTLHIKDKKESGVFTIPAKEYFTFNYKIYCYDTERIPEGFAQIRLSVITHEGDSLPGEMVYLIGGDKRFSGKTDEYGKLVMNIPNNSEYRVGFEDAPNYESFTMPDEANYAMNFEVIFDGSGKNKIYPTLDKALIDFTYLDLYDNPVINDTFSVREIGGDALFECLTDDDGKAYVLVPVGRSYSFSTPFHNNFQTCMLPDEQKRQTIFLTFNGLSSIEYYDRMRIRQNEIRERDSIYQIEYQAYLQFKSLRVEQQRDLKKKDILDRSHVAIESLKQNPDYFVTTEQTVNAVFYRNLRLWKNQIIVTDVTCSMDPYMDQVLLWHAMKLMVDGHKEYIFFNDGDGKMQKEKLIGRAGGLHYTNATEFDTVIYTALYAKSFGCSGDKAENDFEALLESVERFTPLKEIILVADNYSNVRDYELLTHIEVPIRIILCGVKDYVNEQYLDLAYHTKGSVHTLEEDLEMLSRLADGNSISFMGKEYVLSKGRFVYKE